jgi:dethiobiotin synthetase/adenosylmethionine--8-amino-7-oxononanoate aminotransferase
MSKHVPTFEANAFWILGANTDVGKTLVSSSLCKIATDHLQAVSYIKPVQTGGQAASDAKRVCSAVTQKEFLITSTVVTLEAPVSPHLALEMEPLETRPTASLCTPKGFQKALKECIVGSQTKLPRTTCPITLLEGAGGVLSPLHFGMPSADFVALVDFPILLVADSKLGGISGTLCALESLLHRGVPLLGVVCLESKEGNASYLKTTLEKKGILFWSLKTATFSQNESDLDLGEFCAQNFGIFDEILLKMTQFPIYQKSKNGALFEKAKQYIWWPFTQHQNPINPFLVLSNQNGHWQGCFEAPPDDSFAADAQHRLYNGSQSWWTNTNSSLVPQLSSDVAGTISRYGHVLFAETLHEPAVTLAEQLVNSVGDGWAQRAFYSDNGSTALEVALKMAFRWVRKENEKKKRSNPKFDHQGEFRVLGLIHSYHGDTLGTQCAASPNVFNEQEEWYQPKGIWLEYPRVVQCKDGFKVVWEGETPPSGFEAWFLQKKVFKSLNELFHYMDDSIDSIFVMQNYIENSWPDEPLGALLIEPVVQGSAGMHFVLPKFQQMLIDKCRFEKIPVIFDEVFTGFGRLGCPTGSAYLNRMPDIACYSKALTGGVLPLGVTLARESVFNAFLGPSKAHALLHGHSYTAYPAACAAALRSLADFTSRGGFLAGKFQSFWSVDILQVLLSLNKVKWITNVGLILAVTLNLKGGYENESAKVALALGIRNGLHLRVLGNVIYLLGDYALDQEEREQILKALLKTFEEFDEV